MVHSSEKAQNAMVLRSCWQKRHEDILYSSRYSYDCCGTWRCPEYTRIMSSLRATALYIAIQFTSCGIGFKETAISNDGRRLAKVEQHRRMLHQLLIGLCCSNIPEVFGGNDKQPERARTNMISLCNTHEYIKTERRKIKWQ